MQVYTFLYETESGDIGEYSYEATTLLEAEDMVRQLCPDAIDCCIEIQINGEAQ